MKTCRKSVATVLLLLIHLLTLQIDDAVAGRNGTNASDVKRDPRVILEEVIITGSGNNTRVTANAVAEEPSKIGDEIISLLSKRNARRRRLKQTSSDQDADQSHAVTVNAENDEDLERLKRVIAKYEPQRITSRKTKRKIVDGTHDIHDKTIRSNTDLEKIYHEVLRNISRTAPELMVSNANVTFIPSYLSQVIKNLGQIHTPGATIHPASDVGATKTSRFDIDTSPTAKNKKKSIFKKYLQLNRTTASPRISSIEEVDKETADSNESGTAKGYFKAPGARAKNESSESLLSTAEKPESPRKWNAQESPARIAPAFDTQLNNSNAYNIFNAKNSIVPSDVNSLHLLSKYNVAPRPFSILQSPGAPVATNLNILYKKPSVPPTGFNHRQLVRSSANILPLVLPTELFSPPPARYYIPIKRTNHINVDESPATIVSTEANPPANVAKGRTVFDKPSADYSASYADVIGTTKSSLIAANNPRSSGSSDYYAVTENPAETAYVPSQASPSYTLQRQKNPQTVNKNEFLPKIATYDNPEKSDLNANLELALYNKFARLYSVDRPNVFNVPKVIVQDYQDKQPVTSQQVSTLPYSTLKPISPTLLKVQPAKPAVAPYYESRLFASQDGKELNDKDNGESVETNERSRVKNADEAEGEADDDKDNFTNYKTRIDHGASKIRKTPDEQREKEDREETEKEDYHTRNYEHQDKYSKNNKNDKNNDAREKYENIRHENNKDEEDVDETHEDEHVSAGEDEHDQDYRHPYDKYEHDRDDSEEQQDNKSEKKDNKSDEQRYEKRGKENDNRDKHDYKADFKYGLESSNKYSDSRYNDDKTREDVGKFYGNKESDDDRPKKNRQDRKHEDSEEENVAEDKLYTQRSDERVYRQRERNEKKHNKSGDTTHKRKYRPQTIPRKDSRPEEYKREEYSEINPRHVRKEYHNQQQQQHVKNNNNNNQRGHRKYDSGNQDIDNEKLRDHVHGETKEHAHKHEEHHEKKKDGGNHKFEKGEGAEHEEEHHGQEGEEGKKGYKVWHENEKAEKGHHDKEHASKEYDEKNGEKKNHEEEGGYHEQQHHGEEGKKTAEFGEKGEHKKGHSTHGEHSVHKKDEYEKKTEFFDEFHEDDGTEKHGEHHHEHESKKGGHEKKAHHDAADHEAKYGKEDKHEKGGHHHEHKGHKADEGHDHHYDHHEKHGKKEGHEHGKKWSYKEGDGGSGAGGDHKHNR